MSKLTLKLLLQIGITAMVLAGSLTGQQSSLGESGPKLPPVPVGGGPIGKAQQGAKAQKAAEKSDKGADSKAKAAEKSKGAAKSDTAKPKTAK